MTSRIYVPADGPEAWRAALAEPEKHWRQGFSARTLAHCWHDVSVWPVEIAALWQTTAHPSLCAPEPLIKLVEHRTALSGQGRDSQNDLFVLARASDGALVSIVVEGKVNEPFGEQVGGWKTGGDGFNSNKRRRLDGLRETLGLDAIPDDVYYQLLHRAASAVLEAGRFNAPYAVMIVHSFSPQLAHWDAYARFISLYGCAPEPSKLVELTETCGIRLFAGWATGDARYLQA